MLLSIYLYQTGMHCWRLGHTEFTSVVCTACCTVQSSHLLLWSHLHHRTHPPLHASIGLIHCTHSSYESVAFIDCTHISYRSTAASIITDIACTYTSIVADLATQSSHLSCVRTCVRTCVRMYCCTV